MLQCKEHSLYFRELTSRGMRHHVLLPSVVVLMGLMFAVAMVFDLWGYCSVFISLQKESH